MYNIWGFLLQTISVSVVAGIILLLKKIFEDKLSPKWQYGVWSLLAIRILIPVNVSSYVVPQLALWMEMIKANVEEKLSSAFANVYEPITTTHIIPIITKAPQSITDFLFGLYIVGVIFFLLKYLIAYIRLRVLLNKGCSANRVIELKLSTICDKYHLKPCKMITVKGISSAFICGILRPVLVIPAETDVDEKVLLHELLHYKYCDTIQNVGWCILRSLHWCNPLLHLAVNQIENDMESMCDQRVLELLEGEERREYGHILLSMANQKYARVPGTTSISNGGSNISKRIAAIVRFKKYPQGMALVSICIIATMFWPTIIGTAASYDATDYNQHYGSIEKSMAIARINRCNTVAGAIDMYAKGVYQMNGAYVASASSYSEHERIKAELEEYGCYQPGKYVADIDYLRYIKVYNLDQISETEYKGFIVYHAIISNDEFTPEYNDYVPGIEYGDYSAFIFLPISITYEDGWCVKETGERTFVPEEVYSRQENTFILCGKEYYGKNDIGEINLDVEVYYQIDSGEYNFNNTFPNANAHFRYYRLQKEFTYTHLLEERPLSYVEFHIKEMETNEYFEPTQLNFHSMDHNEKGWFIYESTIDWKGSIRDNSGGGFGSDDVIFTDIPSKYTVNWIIGGVEQEQIILEEVTD